MKILNNIPVKIKLNKLLQKLHLDADSDEAREFTGLFNRAVKIARPKACFRECFIDTKTNNTIVIDGYTLTSIVLRKNIGDAQRIFPFVATCGTELDEAEMTNDDFLLQFWLDEIKTELLNISRLYVKNYIHNNYSHLKTTSMSPGSGDADVWPITEQRILFDILGDVQKAINVTLTDSMLMIPNKSISGIRYPAEIDFRTCALCHKENCPTRLMPLDEDLIKEYKGTNENIENH